MLIFHVHTDQELWGCGQPHPQQSKPHTPDKTTKAKLNTQLVLVLYFTRLTGFGDGDRGMREEREEREGYRTAGPSSCEEKIRNTREIFISLSVFFCLRVCVLM